MLLFSYFTCYDVRWGVWFCLIAGVVCLRGFWVWFGNLLFWCCCFEFLAWACCLVFMSCWLLGFVLELLLLGLDGLLLLGGVGFGGWVFVLGVGC